MKEKELINGTLIISPQEFSEDLKEIHTDEEMKDYLDSITIWYFLDDVNSLPPFTPIIKKRPVKGEKAPVEYISKKKFQFDGRVPNQEPSIIGNYRTSEYKCWECERRLYKTSFSAGKEPKLYTTVCTKEEYWEPEQIFTCPNCLRFYAPEKGKDLLDDPFHIIQIGMAFDEVGRHMYNLWYDYFNSLGS